MIDPDSPLEPREYPFEGTTVGKKSGLVAAFLSSRVSGMTQMAYTGYIHKGAPLGLRGLLGGSKPGTTKTPAGLTFGMTALGYKFGGGGGALLGYVASGFMKKGLLEYALGSDKAKELAWGKTASGAQVTYGVGETGQNVFKYGGSRYTLRTNPVTSLYNKLRGRSSIYSTRKGMHTRAIAADLEMAGAKTSKQMYSAMSKYGIGFRRKDLVSYFGYDTSEGLTKIIPTDILNKTKIQQRIQRGLAEGNYSRFLSRSVENRAAHVMGMAHLGDFQPLTQMGKIMAGVPRNFLGKVFFGLRGNKINRLTETLTTLYKGGLKDYGIERVRHGKQMIAELEKVGAPRSFINEYQTEFEKITKKTTNTNRRLLKLRAMEKAKAGDPEAIAGIKAAKAKVVAQKATNAKAMKQFASTDFISKLASAKAQRQTLLTIEQTMGSAIASRAKFMFGFQIGAEMINSAVKGAWNLTEKFRSKMAMTSLLDFGSGKFLETQGASSERQRALQTIQSNHMAASSFLGNEARNIG